MHHEAVQGRAHILRDLDEDIRFVADLKSGLHGWRSMRPGGRTILVMSSFLLLLIAVMLWLLLGVATLLHRARYPHDGAAARAVLEGRPLDPIEAGLDGHDAFTHASDGRDIPLWMVHGAGSGPPRVLIHDWSESPVTMLPRAIEVAGDVSLVLIPCLRGHDRCAGPSTLGALETSDVRRMIETCSDGPVHIEGYGLGGLIARRLEGDACVASIQVIDQWRDARDGLGRIMTMQGFPRWPIVSLAMLVFRGFSADTSST
jgi:hypothetical protein